MTKAREIAELGQKLTVDGSGNLDIAGSGTFDGLTVDGVVTLDTDSGSQPLQITRQGATDQQVKIWVDDDTANYQAIQDEVTGARHSFRHTNGSVTNVETLLLSPDYGAVFNQAGLAAHDFRVEGDTNSHALFVNADNNRIGIKSSAPVRALSVVSQNEDHLALGYSDASWFGLHRRNSDGALVLGGQGGADIVFSTTGGAVFNEGGLDSDFRVESTNRNDMFFVDAGNDQVSIQETLSPSSDWTLKVGNARNLYFQPSLGSTGFYNAGMGFSAYVDSSSTPNQIVLPAGRNTNGGSVIAANYDGGLGFYVYDHGGTGAATANIFSYEKMTLKPSEAVFNENGSDVDFRVESNNNANALFVDAGTSRVGINENSPSSDLHVKNTGAKIRVEGTGGDATFVIERSDSAGAVDYGRFSVQNSAAVVSDVVTRGVGSGAAEIQTWIHNGGGLTKRHTRLKSGGIHESPASGLEHVRWITDSSNFNNPTIDLVTATGTGASYSQCCFEVTMYGNGVSANEHQVFRGGGTFNFDETVSPETAQNLTTYTNYHKGNGLPAVPSFALSGNTLQMTCNRQTNYDTYRVEVRVWGRSITTSYTGYQ